MANVQAGGQTAVPEAGERPLAVNGDQRLLQALTTEHFTLQTARSATIMETNGRSTLFLSTVSSAVVALASSARSPTTASRSSCSRWRCCRRCSSWGC
jgi:hypothetical protein